MRSIKDIVIEIRKFEMRLRYSQLTLAEINTLSELYKMLNKFAISMPEKFVTRIKQSKYIQS